MVELILAVWALVTPLETLITMTYVFITMLFISGIADIVFAVCNRNAMRGWGWFLTLAIMGIIASVIFIISPVLTGIFVATLTGGRAAEEVILKTVTTCASNDIEQATRLARAMVTRYGMSETYGMMVLETVNNPYLSNDASLTCSAETAAEIDREVQKIISTQHEKACSIIHENEAKMNELTDFLLKKETISGEEFMKILLA